MAICEICKVEALPDHEQSLRHVLSVYLSEGRWEQSDPNGMLVAFMVTLAALYPEAFDAESSRSGISNKLRPTE